MKEVIKKMILEDKTNEEILEALKQGENLAPKEKKSYTKPPKTTKPSEFYVKDKYKWRKEKSDKDVNKEYRVYTK